MGQPLAAAETPLSSLCQLNDICALHQKSLLSESHRRHHLCWDDYFWASVEQVWIFKKWGHLQLSALTINQLPIFQLPSLVPLETSDIHQIKQPPDGPDIWSKSRNSWNLNACLLGKLWPLAESRHPREMPAALINVCSVFFCFVIVIIISKSYFGISSCKNLSVLEILNACQSLPFLLSFPCH